MALWVKNLQAFIPFHPTFPILKILLEEINRNTKTYIESFSHQHFKT